jgi:hypothetical protein
VRASVVDKNLTHEPSCNRQEMVPVFGAQGRLSSQAKVNLVNQRSALQRLMLMSRQTPSCDLPQLPIHQRD